MVAFWISLSWKMKAITSLILIHLHLNKISGQYHLRISSLPRQHTVNSLLDEHHSKRAKPYYMTISQLMPKQLSKIQSSIVDVGWDMMSQRQSIIFLFILHSYYEPLWSYLVNSLIDCQVILGLTIQFYQYLD